MTPERLKTLRFLANFAAYHIPGEHREDITPVERRLVAHGEAGDDILELCDVVATAAELLDACKRLLKFNEELAVDVGVSTHYPSAELARRAIAKAEGTFDILKSESTGGG